MFENIWLAAAIGFALLAIIVTMAVLLVRMRFRQAQESTAQQKNYPCPVCEKPTVESGTAGRLCPAGRHIMDPNWVVCPYCEGERKDSLPSSYREPEKDYLFEDYVGGVEKEKRTLDHVEFNVFVPRQISPGHHFVLDVWAHLVSDYDLVCKRARELAREINVGRKAAVPILEGSPLEIFVKIQGMKVIDSADFIFWDGKPANASFAVEVPLGLKVGSWPGSATISMNGMAIARVTFSIVVSSTPDETRTDRSETLEFPRNAFASYASPDRLDVLERVQGIKTVRPDLDIFLDVLSLRSGQDWRQKLEQHVPTKDIFYLFWSLDAANSPWVNAEWRMALEKRGLDYIHPVPLVEPEVVPPPQELSGLHFSDPELPYIQHAKHTQRFNDGGTLA